MFMTPIANKFSVKYQHKIHPCFLKNDSKEISKIKLRVERAWISVSKHEISNKYFF